VSGSSGLQSVGLDSVRQTKVLPGETIGTAPPCALFSTGISIAAQPEL
jgi:hypothetical protein